jgi:hypothetical protein
VALEGNGRNRNSAERAFRQDETTTPGESGVGIVKSCPHRCPFAVSHLLWHRSITIAGHKLYGLLQGRFRMGQPSITSPHPKSSVGDLASLVSRVGSSGQLSVEHDNSPCFEDRRDTPFVLTRSRTKAESLQKSMGHCATRVSVKSHTRNCGLWLLRGYMVVPCAATGSLRDAVWQITLQ